MAEIRTEIEIDAAPERVWEVLTDFEAYPEWNPHITSIVGEARLDAPLTARMKAFGGRGVTMKPRVVRFDEAKEFRWIGRLLLPRVFDGEHIFELHALDGGGTRFVQREEFRGVLVWPLLRMGRSESEKGFVAMNEALKARAEAG